MTRGKWNALVFSMWAAALMLPTVRASGLSIETFERGGELSFDSVSYVEGYRVEWAPNPDGPWSSSWSALAWITATHPQTVNVSVPMFYRVVGEITVPNDMVPIPGGTFLMGDSFAEADDDELPVHSVTVSGFWIRATEMTNDEMIRVLQYAYDVGKLIVTPTSVRNAEGDERELVDLDEYQCRITWDGSQFGLTALKGAGYPCVDVSWYGAVAYCNYRSELEGRTPCYNLNDWTCNWSANGYRLPTEAEWEYAARGGVSGTRFPWGDTISHSQANYYSSPSPDYDVSPTAGYHPDYRGTGFPNISPVGSFAPNGYGLFDVIGNQGEWVWDSYSEVYYLSSPSTNPRGPAPGAWRTVRGGTWFGNAEGARLAYRGQLMPGSALGHFGFRPARQGP